MTPESAEKIVKSAFKRRVKHGFSDRIYASLQLFESHCPKGFVWLGREIDETIELVPFAALRKAK